MLSPATFQPFRQRHVAGETYPQRNVAGEKLMGRFPSDMSLGKGPFEFDFSTLFASIVLSFSGFSPAALSLGKEKFADAFARYDSGGASGSGGSRARDREDGDDTGGEDGGDDTS
ncbi:hypothetical protein Tco_1283317 [Tanacetum coccineum]